jgi:hypothetical protein
MKGRDKTLIGDFLRGYNEYIPDTYQIATLPDELERQASACDAVAQNAAGRTLAIEHTLLQPFVGEKGDTQPFLRVFARLEQDETLRVPNRSIYVCVPVGAVPKGAEWDEAGIAIERWLRQNRLSIPDGQSAHSVPGLSFQLSLKIHKTPVSNREGRILVGRSLMKDDFPEVVKIALGAKLPKLIGTQADTHILLLELDNIPRHPAEVTEVILSLQPEMPGLEHIDAIWCAQTVSWETQGGVDFYRVWPPGAEEWLQFRVSGLPITRPSTTDESPWRFLKFAALLPVFWLVAVFAIGLASRQMAIPDNPRWDWIIRMLGIILAGPACWFAVGAKARAAARFTYLASVLYLSVSNLLYSVAVVAGVVALVLVFVKGAEWEYAAICLPSMRLASIALWMIVPVALFMCNFKRARAAAFALMFLSSIVCGFAVWAYSLYVAAGISLLWMVIGTLGLGLGVIPVALIGSCLKGAWGVAGFITAGAAIVGLLRYGGLFGLYKAANPAVPHKRADER